jgi:hypothetical protein
LQATLLFSQEVISTFEAAVELRALSLKPYRFRRIGMLLQREGAQKPSVNAWLDLSGSHWIV